MQTIQDIIHKFEVGEGRRLVSIAAGILLFITILFLYNLREASGYASVEAMDAGQVARNIAEGKGYSTDFIRPLSMALLKDRRGETTSDPYVLNGPHPDLANPPVYPYFLAALMKVLPFDFEIPALRSKNFWRYQPEVWIGYANQVLFVLSGCLVFILGRQLFDSTIGWFGLVVFMGNDLMWRFSFSGLSTHLAILLFLCLVWVLCRLERTHPVETYDEEERSRRTGHGVGHYVGWGLVAGLLLGLLTLTRYSLGWLCLPVILYFLFYLSGRRLVVVGSTLLMMAIIVTPWLARNYDLSGKLFGTASFAVAHETPRYIGTELEKFLKADLDQISLSDGIRKYLRNTGSLVESGIPNLGGSWITPLFLVGLLVPFSNRSLNRLRIFIGLGLLSLATAQALTRTYLSEYSPEINSENLVVLFFPLICIFGSGLFFLLLDQLNLNFTGAQFYLSILMAFLACLPLVFRILPPRSSPVVYPPYSPPLIQRVGNWFQDDELLMSDMPWAMGWYGGKTSLWLTRNLEPDFFEINDRYRPINGLYLTPLTTDGKFVSDMIRNQSWAWGRLHMDITLRENLPKGFPLLHVDDGFMPDQLILTDWPRWNSADE